MNGAKYATQQAVQGVLAELGIRPTHYALSQRRVDVVLCGTPVEISLALPVVGGEDAVLNRIREALHVAA